MIAYKLFRLMKDKSLAPLFINPKLRLETGIWMEAEDHPTKGFAHRVGWHCCFKPIAPHLSMKTKGGSDRIWVQVEVEDWKKYDRPECQGGAWVLANRLKVIKRLPEILDTIGTNFNN